MKDETGPSRDAHHHEAWDPTWTIQRFTAPLRCNDCREIVTVSGEITQTEFAGENDWDYEDAFQPKFFYSAPPLMKPPTDCPEGVVGTLLDSHPLYWCAERTCATTIGIAIELMLTERGIPLEITGRDNKSRMMPLHDRIVAFGKLDKESCDLLLTLKVVRNVGTHGSGHIDLVKEDLLDTYEILEYVLERVYGRRSERMAKLAGELLDRMTKPKPPSSDDPLF